MTAEKTIEKMNDDKKLSNSEVDTNSFTQSTNSKSNLIKNLDLP